VKRKLPGFRSPRKNVGEWWSFEIEMALGILKNGSVPWWMDGWN
jgi:hypothetical protein